MPKARRRGPCLSFGIGLNKRKLLRFNCNPKRFSNELVLQTPGVLIVNTVASIWINHEIELFVRLLQRPYELKRIGRMDVVVAQAVNQQQPPVQVRGRRHD